MCDAIKLCQPDPRKHVADKKCVLCKYAVTELDQINEDKHKQDSIRNGLEKVCNIMPSSVRDQCTQLVDQYSDMLIDLIAKDLTPEQVGTAKDCLSHKSEELKSPTLKKYNTEINSP